FTNDLQKKLSDAGMQPAIKTESNMLAQTLVGFLPIALFLLVLYFLFRQQIRMAGKGALNFGKSKARMLARDKNKITFRDVAGVEEAKDEVQELVEFLRDPKKFQKLGGRIPKGVLLVGPPGTGKTLLARAIAGEADVPFFSISGSDFVEMFVGEHARFRFPEVEGAFASHADLLAEQKVEHEQKKSDRQKTDHGLGKHVGFSFDGWLNAGGSELLLQITRESQIDRGSKRNLLRRRRTHSLANISATQGLRRPAVLDHQLERIIFVGDDLFVLQQLEKPVVRYLFDRLHSSPEIEHGERDTPEADREQDDAAPIKIGLVPAGFILLLRVTIGLWHKRNGILARQKGYHEQLAMQNGGAPLRLYSLYIVATHCVARRFR